MSQAAGGWGCSLIRRLAWGQGLLFLHVSLTRLRAARPEAWASHTRCLEPPQSKEARSCVFHEEVCPLVAKTNPPLMREGVRTGYLGGHHRDTTRDAPTVSPSPCAATTGMSSPPGQGFVSCSQMYPRGPATRQMLSGRDRGEAESTGSCWPGLTDRQTDIADLPGSLGAGTPAPASRALERLPAVALKLGWACSRHKAAALPATASSSHRGDCGPRRDRKRCNCLKPHRSGRALA